MIKKLTWNCICRLSYRYPALIHYFTTTTIIKLIAFIITSINSAVPTVGIETNT